MQRWSNDQLRKVQERKNGKGRPNPSQLALLTQIKYDLGQYFLRNGDGSVTEDYVDQVYHDMVEYTYRPVEPCQ